MARFIDRVVLHLQAGDGGHGCVSVHREKFKPLGGPDGGNGGHGGDIILEVSEQIHTLMDFHYRPHIKAQRGGNGAGDMRNGGRGEDLILEVPAGTVVRTERAKPWRTLLFRERGLWLQKAGLAVWAMPPWPQRTARHRVSLYRVSRVKHMI